MSQKKLLVVQIAALGWELAQKQRAFTFQKAASVFPAVTCTAQASFRTASAPESHGLVANGLFFRDLHKILFWEQSAALVQGGRIWKNFRHRGGRVGMMFWQQSLGEEVDLVLSPAPIHKHGGGMIQDCYAQPREFGPRLEQSVGRPFNLMNYWGPLASRKSSDWIVDATCATMAMRDLAPDVLFSYVPHLDYDLQRHGPDSRQAEVAMSVLLGHLDRLRAEAHALGYEFLFFGDYAIEPVTGGAIFPNQCLRDAGLLASRSIKKMSYADLFSSRAFAMVDHQVAHVFTADSGATEKARSALAGLPGVEAILDREAQKEWKIDHARSGDLVLVAKPGAWFAYPWWREKREAPDYATHVDIHNKPGYDPCELFFGWPPLSVSMDTTRIRGSHGRTGAGTEIAWTSSVDFPDAPANLVGLALATRNWLDS